MEMGNCSLLYIVSCQMHRLSVNEESAIISSQSEINRSPNAQRYKMCFERKE